MRSSRLSIDHDRADSVVTRLAVAYEQREGILSETDDLVENQIPEGVALLSSEHARFLFYVVSNDRGTKSSRLYARAKQLFKDDPQIFEPAYVVAEFSGPDDPILVRRSAAALGARYPQSSARAWYLNSTRLVRQYDGDPRLLFQAHGSARGLIAAIIGFDGYGPKTGGILLRAAVGLGFAKVRDLEAVLVPVDIHDSRISFFTGIVQSASRNTMPAETTHYRDHVATIQMILRDSCQRVAVSWLDVDRALWLIGSRGCVYRLCEKCPLNQMCTAADIPAASDAAGNSLPC